MDIKTLLDNLHEEVSCTVCKKVFTDPKMLPCYHSFCLKCLKRIQRKSGSDEITCPKCGRNAFSKSEKLDDLSTNFRINSLLDVLAIKECNTTAVKCGNCDKKSSQSVYCFQCCDFWCEATCISHHEGMKAYKEHRVLALKDFQDEDFENVLKRPVFCQKKHHEKEELKFFCTDCRVAVCTNCVLTDHGPHNKIDLEEAANKRTSEVKSGIKSQNEKAQQMRDKIRRLEKSLTQIKEEAATVKQDAEEHAVKMISVIEAKKQEICNEVDGQVQTSELLLQKQKSKIEEQLRMIERAIKKTETRLKQSISAEILLLDVRFPEEDSNEREFDCDLEVPPQFAYVENEKLTKKMTTEVIDSLKSLLNKTCAHKSSVEGKGIRRALIGQKTQFRLITRNANGHQCYEEHDHVTVEIRNCQGHDCVKGHECTTKAQVQNNNDGTYDISYFVKETGKCDVSVKVNGEHVNGSPFIVEVKRRQPSPLSKTVQPHAVSVLEFRNNSRIQVCFVVRNLVKIAWYKVY